MYKIARVEWKDACKYGDYNTHGIEVLYSVGYIVVESEEYIALAQEIDTEGKRYRDTVSIPKSCVLEVVSIHL